MQRLLSTLLIFAFLIPVFVPQEAQGAVVDHVEHGSVTLTGSSVTDTLVTTLTDTSKAILTFTVRTDNNRPDRVQTRGIITDTTTLTFNRGASVGTVEIDWQVTEFTSGVSVQRGTFTGTNNSSDDITVSAVTMANSFIIATTQKDGGSWSADDWPRIELTSTTNIQVQVPGGMGTSARVDWQLVEYTASSVQRGLLSFASGDSATSTTITSVDRDKSVVVISFYSESGTTANIGQKMIAGYLPDSTTVTLTRANTGQAVEASWEVVEFTDDTSVQYGLVQFGTSDTQIDTTVSSVATTSTAIMVAGHSSTMGTTTYSGDDNSGVGSATFEFTSDTNLRATRAVTGSAPAGLSWYVVTFPSAAAPPPAPSSDDGFILF